MVTKNFSKKLGAVQSRKKSGPPGSGNRFNKNKQSFGRPGQKRSFGGGGGDRGPRQMNKFESKSPAKFSSPNQAKNFGTPNKGQKFQTPKQGQFSGKKAPTPHPKKSVGASDDDEDEDEDEEDEDEMEDEDESEEDESDESLEDESEEQVSTNGGPAQKKLTLSPLKQAAGGSPKKGDFLPLSSKSAKKDEESDEDEDESMDDEDFLSDEMEESDSEGIVPAKATVAAKQNVKAPKGVPQQQAAKKVSPAGQLQKSPTMFGDQESDEDEEDEDEEDEDEEEDEEEEDEGESDESDDDEVPVKVGKNQDKKGILQKRTAQDASIKGSQVPQKKGKTNDGVAISKGEKSEGAAQKSMLTNLDKKLLEEEEDRRKERDQRSLFVKNFPRNATEDDIKALSSDILYVKRKNINSRYAWIMFANEQVCQKNYAKLKDMKVGSDVLFVDYCGDKSKSSTNKREDQRVDALKLYIGNLPHTATEEGLRKKFPTAASIFRNPKKTFAFIGFASPEAARQAFEKSKDVSIDGSKVLVNYAREGRPYEKRPKEDPVKKFAKEKAGGKIKTKGKSKSK